MGQRRKKFGKAVLKSPAFQSVASFLVAWFIRFIHATNRPVAGLEWQEALKNAQTPVIIALWHGQHIMAPCFKPDDRPYVALLSKSRDAEINARIVARFGIKTIRGSGGRAEAQRIEKGGAEAFLRLKRAMEEGHSVVMIADISKAEARKAGRGVVALAKATGFPIVPMACAYSRRKVLEKTWDKTTIALPFGRYASVAQPPLYVDKNADDAAIQKTRNVVTDSLNQATEEAYRLVEPYQ